MLCFTQWVKEANLSHASSAVIFRSTAMKRLKALVFPSQYLVPERKLGFLVQIKEDENFNHRNTLSISRIKI